MNELNSQFRSVNSPLARNNFVSGYQFESQYEVQTKNLKVGKISVGSLIRISGTADAVGTISGGNRAVFTTDISPGTGFVGNIIAGWPAQEIYEGTEVNGSQLIYPAPGGSIATDRWRCSSGFRTLGGSEINHRFEVVVHNNTGGPLPVYGVATWKYIINGGGTQG
jgi:hypothetical protein